MALARHTDPSTSHEAAERVERSGRGKTQQGICRDEVYRQPGQTSGEIAQATGLDRYVVSRRLSEIKSIRKGAARECTVLGSRQVTWWPINSVESNCRPHNNPDNYVVREGVAHCKLCRAYIGRVRS